MPIMRCTVVRRDSCFREKAMTVKQLELEEGVYDREELSEDTEENLSVGSLWGIESDDVIALYMKEVGSIPLLTSEEETQLGLAVREGDAARRGLVKGDVSGAKREEQERAVARGEAARRRFIESNSRLVISIARKYLGRGMPLSDLMQEGNLGLMKAERGIP